MTTYTEPSTTVPNGDGTFTQTTVTNDGSIARTFDGQGHPVQTVSTGTDADGQPSIRTTYPDGTSAVGNADGSQPTTVYPDHVVTTVTEGPDGRTVDTSYPDGTGTVTRPDGSTTSLPTECTETTYTEPSTTAPNGDGTFTETTVPNDGSIARTFDSQGNPVKVVSTATDDQGSANVRSTYPDGTSALSNADGSQVTTVYPDHVVTTVTEGPDGRTVDTSYPDGTGSTTNTPASGHAPPTVPLPEVPAPLTVLQPDGNLVRFDPDGSQVIFTSDGSYLHTAANGTVISQGSYKPSAYRPPATTTVQQADGTTVALHPGREQGPVVG